MKLSVVVPVKNEQENIIPLLEEIHAALEGKHEFEVIYVNDGSTDATPRILREAMARFPRLRVFEHVASCGQSTAVMTAVRNARGEWIATLDGDGQNDPADIPAMLAAAQAPNQPANLQCIAGWRTQRKDTWIKKISSRIANGVRSRLLRDATPDTGCGLKLIPRTVYLQLPFFNHMHRFLPALIQRNGGATISVPVNHRPRVRGVSNYGLHNRLWVGIVDIFGVAWLQRRMKRPTVSEVARP